MMLLLPLVTHAAAMDTPWDCSAPADLVEMRAVEFADPDMVWDAAWEAAWAWVDPSCVAACDGIECEEANCVTAAGAEVEYRSSFDLDDNGEKRLVVRLPDGAGASWTEIALEGEWNASSDHFGSRRTSSWTASWVGTLVEGWPADEAASSTYVGDSGSAGGESSSSYTTTFAGSGCAWSSFWRRLEGDSCNPAWGSSYEREINGIVGTVGWRPGCGASCDDGWYSGTFEGVSVGSVDPDTWAPTGSIDADGDGYYAEDHDCDDGNAAIYACAEDAPYDGVDADCMEDDDFDGDGDGHYPIEHGGGDCDDTSWSTHPGATEVECDGRDRDCDGADPCSEDTAAPDTADTGSDFPDFPDPSDTGDTGDTAADTATTSARPAPPEERGCGGGAALLALLPLLGVRRRG